MSVISTKANIAKITRQVGKAEVQIVLTIPVGKSADIPMGDVLLTVEPVQKDMFAKDASAEIGGPGSRQRFSGVKVTRKKFAGQA